ncbi:MAG TPA: 4,5-DOPA dioxygenase extradiol [Steroidobacteraceae bacterium]|nr:4,5-DOPA dioxygenase extradiol [Steroidobacteraceae bacterium]
MPAVFVGHGNPMNAILDNGFSRAWKNLGRELPKPQAILCISAHWYTPEVAVTAMAWPRTIHDFGGFPRGLFEVEYQAPGSPELAERVRDLLNTTHVRLDYEEWGLDHGTWSVLCHMYPEAEVPVVQLSIDETRPAEWHYELAARLESLRDERVLIMGSGNLVHNLHAYAWGRRDVPALDWAERFDLEARTLIAKGRHEPLIAYERMGYDAALSAPTPDHYLPLLYVLAQQRPGDAVSFPVRGFDGGSVSMLSIRIG